MIESIIIVVGATIALVTGGVVLGVVGLLFGIVGEGYRLFREALHA